MVFLILKKGIENKMKKMPRRLLLVFALLLLIGGTDGGNILIRRRGRSIFGQGVTGRLWGGF